MGIYLGDLNLMSKSFEKVVRYEVTDDASEINIPIESSDKIKNADEILIICEFHSTKDTSITAKGNFTVDLNNGISYQIFARPDYNSSSVILPYSATETIIPRIYLLKRLGTAGMFVNKPNEIAFECHRGTSNSMNWNYTSSVVYNFCIGNNYEPSNLHVKTSTKFGSGTVFTIYVK